MIKKIGKILIVLSFFFGNAQAKLEVINKSNGLIAEKKYESAFSVLDQFDENNSDAEIFLLKQDLLLRYFVTSLSHKMFSLKDLKPEEDIMDYRGKEGKSKMVIFDIEEIATKLLQNEPKNFKLNKALADFYYDALLKYGANWTKSYEELKSLIEENYKIAIENNAGDYMSYYSLGYLTLLDKNYKEAIEYFKKSIDLKSDYPTSNYNLGIAYLYEKEDENALKYVLKSYDLYTDAEYKSDAARVASQLYFEKDDLDNAIKYIEIANKIYPENYYNLKLMLDVYASKNHPDFLKIADSFLMIDPSNPGIYNDLEGIFYKNKRQDELLIFLNNKKDLKEFDVKALATIHFYIAKYYSFNKDNKLSKENALKSKKYFLKVYKDEKHEVFGLLDQLINNSQK